MKHLRMCFVFFSFCGYRYSGIYSQRKKSAKVGKAKVKAKKVCRSEKKIIKAVGLGPALTQEISVTDGGATIDHTKTSR